MPGPLNILFEHIGTRLPSDIAVEVGRDKVHLQGDAPRLVWAPDREKIVAAPANYYRPKADPKTIKLRVVTVEAHIWGADQDVTEVLIADVVRAIHLAAHVADKQFEFEIGDGEWKDDDGGTTTRGVGYVLLVELRVPIVLNAAVRVAPLTPHITKTIEVPVTGHTTTEG